MADRGSTVFVGAARLFLTNHAVERYVERVKPHLSADEARAELRRVLPDAELVFPAPSWMGVLRRHQRVVVLADSIAFPVLEDRLMSCVCRSSVGAEIRMVRNESRPRQQKRKATEDFSKRSRGRARAERQRRGERFGEAEA